jgi:hypothetical protein
MNNSYIVTVINNHSGETKIEADWQVEGCTSDAELYIHAAAAIGRCIEVLGTTDVSVNVRLCVA